MNKAKTFSETEILRSVVELSLSLTNDLKNSELYEKIVDTILRLTGAQAGIARSHETATDTIKTNYCTGIDKEIAEQINVADLLTGIGGTTDRLFFSQLDDKLTDRFTFLKPLTDTGFKTLSVIRIENQSAVCQILVLWKSHRVLATDNEAKTLEILNEYLQKFYRQKNCSNDKTISISDFGVRSWNYDLTKSQEISHPIESFPDLMDALHTAGIPVNEILGDVYPEDMAKVEIELARSIRSRSDYELEYRVGSNPEEVRWVKAKGRVETDLKGQPVLIKGSNIDITGFKESEEELIESRANSNFLLELSDAIRYVSDPVEVQELVATMVGRFLGVSLCYYGAFNGEYWIVEKEYASPGTSISAIAKLSEENFPQVKETFSKGDAFVSDNMFEDTRLTEADKQISARLGLIAFVSAPILIKGELKGWFNLVQSEPRIWKQSEIDLVKEVAKRTQGAVEHADALKVLTESEKEMRAINSLVPAMLWRFDATCENMSGHQKFLDYTGLTKDEAQNGGWANAIHPDDIIKTHENLGVAIATGTPGEVELRIRDKNHNYRWFIAKQTPEFDIRGNVTAWFGVAIDVHRQRILTTELEKSEKKYRNLFNSMDEGYILVEVIYDAHNHPIDLLYVESNSAAEKLAGMSLTGKTTKGISTLIEDHWYEIYDEVAKTGVPVRKELVSRYFDETYDFYLFKAGENLVGCVFRSVLEQRKKERDLANQARFNSFRAEINQALRLARNAEQIHREAMHILYEHLQTKSVSFLEVKEQGAIVHVERDFIHGDSCCIGIFQMASLPVIYEILKNDEIVNISDIENSDLSPGELEFYSQKEIKAALIVPLYRNNQWVSALTVYNAAVRVWNDYEIRMAQETLERVWEAVELLRVEETLKNSERKYRTLFETMDEAYVLVKPIFDENGLVRNFLYLDANHAAVEMAGKELKDKTCIELWGGIDPEWSEILDRVVKTGIGERHVITSAILGRTYNSYFFKTSDGNENHIAGIYEDITDKKCQEEALKRSEARLRHLLQRTEEYISIASHELKTPITSLKLYTQFMMESAKRGNEIDFKILNQLNSQTDRLTQLVHDLLDVSRLTIGQFRLVKKEFDINELVTEKVEELRGTCRHRFEICPGEAPHIVADRSRIGQVFVNLISNAIKHSPQESKITIKTMYTDDGIRVSISDEGIGICDEDAKKIFQKYYRASEKFGTSGGLGLGLFISERIVSAHGGKIFVESTPGRGSEFFVTLPVNTV